MMEGILDDKQQYDQRDVFDMDCDEFAAHISPVAEQAKRQALILAKLYDIDAEQFIYTEGVKERLIKYDGRNFNISEKRFVG